MTEECRQAIKLVARTEGIFLDPVYTGKTMAGLIDLVRKGKFTSKDTVVFFHTGGVAALFAYAKEMTQPVS
jgi:1-aminocyclopropane-1-carboxylate deaminase/D-cysteine desulfhydrase-like pyridoxal-dependent ACC family enzyme